MQTASLWLLILCPALLAVAAVVPGPALAKADRVFAAGLISIAGAIAAAAILAMHGPMTTPTLGGAGIGFALRLDALSAIVFLLVAFVGVVVVRYSRNYLAGDTGQSRFMTWLALAIAAVFVLILSGNLFQLALAWIATSLALGRLLLFYPERPNAVLAARKKAVVGRLGDGLLVGAAVLLYAAFGTLDIGEISSAARALGPDGATGTISTTAILIALAALLKSAQVPLHGWLLEVMETPTPVSALLHAGIINAGGFLLLRLADVLAASAVSLHVLLVVGGVTALVGSVVMLTQTSIKLALAWSTIAQMGFMMMQIGLGAFSAALLHIVAHSLYKAHAFLSSGSVIDIARASWTLSPGGRPHPGRLSLAVALLLVVALFTATLFGISLADQPGVLALGAIVALGLVHLVVSAVDERPTGSVIARTLVIGGAVSISYFALQAAAALLTAGALPPVQPLGGWFDLVGVVIVVGGFAAITVLQAVLPSRAAEPRWQAIYTHVSNGFYLNTLANRLAIRLWPAPAPRPTTSSAQG